MALRSMVEAAAAKPHRAGATNEISFSHALSVISPSCQDDLD